MRLATFLGALLAVTPLLCAAAEATALDWLDKYNVVWDTPSENALGSMPLGNGDIGLNAWAEKDGSVQFIIGKTDAWDDNARLVKVGKVRVQLEPEPLRRRPAVQANTILRDATLKVTAGEGEQKTTVQVWVDANHPVIQVASRKRLAARGHGVHRTVAHEPAGIQGIAVQRHHDQRAGGQEEADDHRAGHGAAANPRPDRSASAGITITSSPSARKFWRRYRD